LNHVGIRGGVIIFGLLLLGLLFIYQERNKGLFIRGWPVLTEAPAFTKPLQQAKWLSTILVMYIIFATKLLAHQIHAGSEFKFWVFKKMLIFDLK
jgi:hypothetical protein